jgi:hypothetical protein
MLTQFGVMNLRPRNPLLGREVATLAGKSDHNSWDGLGWSLERLPDCL